MPSDPSVIRPSQDASLSGSPSPGSATGGAMPSASTLSGHATTSPVTASSASSTGRLTGAGDGTSSGDPVSGGMSPSSGGTGMDRDAGTAGSSGSHGAGGASGTDGASGDRQRSSQRWRSRDGARRAASSALPSITTMIRMDHSHVLANFHRFRPNLSSLRQQAIADAICLALEVHAQLEEEIFYPALQEVAGDDPVLKDARPEHDQMRQLIADLRGCEPGEPRFRETLNQLMRDVMHHVADEEAVLLPLAETRLADRLGELGAQMTRRRLSLVAPHTLEMAKNQALATPVMTLAALGAVAGGAWWLASSLGSSRR